MIGIVGTPLRVPSDSKYVPGPATLIVSKGTALTWAAPTAAPMLGAKVQPAPGAVQPTQNVAALAPEPTEINKATTRSGTNIYPNNLLTIIFYLLLIDYRF